MAENPDNKHLEAMFILQQADKKAKLLDEAKGQFKFTWRDAASSVALLVFLFSFYTQSIYSKDLAIAMFIFLAAEQINRVSKLERRINAMAKLLLQD